MSTILYISVSYHTCAIYNFCLYYPLTSLWLGVGRSQRLTSSTCDSMRILTTLTALTLTAYALVACVPANTPDELAALAEVKQKAQASYISTQSAAIPITQDAQQRMLNDSYTQTALPPELTTIAITQNAAQLIATVESDNATQQHAANVLVYSQTVASATENASNTQARIAENNRVIADSMYYGQLWRDVLTWTALLALFGLGVLIAWCIIQVGIYVHHTRHDREISDKWKRTFEAERLMLAAGIAPTSSGHTSYAITIAEKHLMEYQGRDSKLRAALKNYVTACVDLSQRGELHPFSRPTAAKYALVTHPARNGEWWQLGHKRIMDALFTLNILTNTGKGGETTFATGVDADNYSRIIDLAPLPADFPDPLPGVKITVAGYQLAQV